MAGDERDQDQWNEALSDAAAHVVERASAQAQVKEKAKPRPRGPILAGLSFLLVLVAGWDVYVLTRPPEGLPASEQEVDLRWTVAEVVEAVEDFREVEGRLPTGSELVEITDEEEVSYTVEGERFRVGLEVDGVRVEYDGSISLDAWTEQAPTASSGSES